MPSMRSFWHSWSPQLKLLLATLKPWLRWVVLGATLFFIGSVLRQHWQEVSALRISRTGWRWLALSLGITLLAHIWTGWVWSWILRELGQPAAGRWGVIVYLKTNIAKYLPGNIWHFYGRVLAAKQAGISTTAAALSVLLEPLLMAAAALIIALTNADRNWLVQLLCLLVVLAAVHPKILNPLLRLARQLKGQTESTDARLEVRRYPLLPLLGELGFVSLRAVGFIFAVWSLQPLAWQQLPPTFSAFSIAWVLGLVIPGAPGGIGVFEATTIALLSHHLAPSVILGSVALYRLISLLAEIGGAGLAYLVRR